MKEIKVDRILPEHEDMEAYVEWDNNWHKIFCVATNEWWDGIAGIFSAKKITGWLVRTPEPPEKKPSERIYELYCLNQKNHGCQPECGICKHAERQSIIQWLDEDWEKKNK